MSSSREGGKDYSICQLINLIKPETLNQTNWNLAKVSQIIFVLVNNKIVTKNHGAIRNFLEPPIFAKNVFFNSSYFKCLLIPIIFVDMLFRTIFRTQTVWKVSKCGVFSGPYFPVFGLNTGKYGPEKLRILTLFTQSEFTILLILVSWITKCFVLTQPKLWCHGSLDGPYFFRKAVLSISKYICWWVL